MRFIDNLKRDFEAFIIQHLLLIMRFRKIGVIKLLMECYLNKFLDVLWIFWQVGFQFILFWANLNVS